MFNAQLAYCTLTPPSSIACTCLYAVISRAHYQKHKHKSCRTAPPCRAHHIHAHTPRTNIDIHHIGFLLYRTSTAKLHFLRAHIFCVLPCTHILYQSHTHLPPCFFLVCPPSFPLCVICSSLLTSLLSFQNKEIPPIIYICLCANCFCLSFHLCHLLRATLETKTVTYIALELFYLSQRTATQFVICNQILTLS